MKPSRILRWTIGLVVTLVVIDCGVAAPQWVLSSYAASGNLKGVSFLLGAGVDPNTPYCDAGTAIVRAAQNGQTVVVKELIDNGANVNIYPEGYETALAAAASRGHLDTMKVLLAGGANPNADRGGEATPLVCAQGYPKEIKLLKAAGEKD